MAIDIALINANIKTMNSTNSVAEALAITKNKIVKVGSNQEITALIDKDTKVIDLKRKTVLPGLIDTHIHVADYGRCLMWLDLTEAKSIAEIQKMVEDKAKSVPPGKWIIGQGWSEKRFKDDIMLERDVLDTAAPNNPVILYREASMICAVNTQALKLAGVTKHTQPPKGGNIDKNPDTGELTGILRETATTMVWGVVPEPTEEELLEATVVACQKIVDAGITSVHWLVISESELAIIQKMHLQNRIPFRVNVIVPEELYEKAFCLKVVNDQMLKIAGVFIVVDGYLDSKEAALVEPYSDNPTNKGKLLLNYETLKSALKKAIALGTQPVIHAMGDRAIDLTLTVIEQSQNDAIRFRIEQAAVLNKSLIDRIKKQKAVITVQPKVISTEFTVWSAIQSLGDRTRFLHPLKTLFDNQIVVAAGSDCPMEPLSALLGVQEAILRPNFPEQRLTLDEALRMYTSNAAYCAGEDSLKGSIEEGKFADLTILSYDPADVDPSTINDIKIESVMVNGVLLKDSLSII